MIPTTPNTRLNPPVSCECVRVCRKIGIHYTCGNEVSQHLNYVWQLWPFVWKGREGVNSNKYGSFGVKSANSRPSLILLCFQSPTSDPDSSVIGEQLLAAALAELEQSTAGGTDRARETLESIHFSKSRSCSKWNSHKHKNVQAKRCQHPLAQISQNLATVFR